jgi:hypothetical protein
MLHSSDGIVATGYLSIATVGYGPWLQCLSVIVQADLFPWEHVD